MTGILGELEASMPEHTPRIPPLAVDQLPSEFSNELSRWRYNLHRCLAHNPDTLLKWMPYAEHILLENKIPEREREIAILRVAWNCQCDYEWSMHAGFSRTLGFTEDDLKAIPRGPEDRHWTDIEKAVLKATDEIQATWCISDETWRVLAAEFANDQLIDLIFVICQFILVAVTLNSLRVPLEPNAELLPPQEAPS